MDNKDTISDPLEHIRKIQKLTVKKNEKPNLKRKEEIFWNTDCPMDIFKSHPDSAKAILCHKNDVKTDINEVDNIEE